MSAWQADSRGITHGINVTETWSSIFDRHNGRRFEQGYSEGRNAGGIYIYNGAGFAMEGELDGHVITGERQAAGGKGRGRRPLQDRWRGPTKDYPWLTSNVIVTIARSPRGYLRCQFHAASGLFRFYDAATIG